MANQYGISAREILSGVESIKGQRSSNALRNQQIEQAKTSNQLNKFNLDQGKNAVVRNNTIEGLRGDVLNGSAEAEKKLLQLDPEGGSKFISYKNSMGDVEKKQVQQQIEQMGSMQAEILQSPPEQRQAMYAQMRSMVPPEMAKLLPEVYNEQQLVLSVAKLKTMDQILEAPTVKTIGTNDVVYKNGIEIERAENPNKQQAVKKNALIGKENANGNPKEMGSSDESLMYRQTVELLGGVFDANGNFQALEPGIREKAQAIATEAAKVYKSEGNISRSESVAKAARKFGVKVEEIKEQVQGEAGGNNSDPLGIR